MRVFRGCSMLVSGPGQLLRYRWYAHGVRSACGSVQMGEWIFIADIVKSSTSNQLRIGWIDGRHFTAANRKKVKLLRTAFNYTRYVSSVSTLTRCVCVCVRTSKRYERIEWTCMCVCGCMCRLSPVLFDALREDYKTYVNMRNKVIAARRSDGIGNEPSREMEKKRTPSLEMNLNESHESTSKRFYCLARTKWTELPNYTEETKKKNTNK